MNVRHLRWGTHAENMREAGERKLMQSGERHSHAKLTQQIADQIRDAIEAGQSGKNVARLFSVSESTVSMIRNGHRW